MEGILNLNKPSGLTSHDAVLQIRRLLGKEKVGHSGTLDPLASGVLPLCIGRGTRIARFISAGSKEYRTVARLGLETDTLDRSGRVLVRHDAGQITAEQIEETLADFRGLIEQIPPMFSALKRNGQPLYKLARQGITVDRPPRRVQIYSLKLIDFSPPYFTLEIECSSGTYVRSLLADIGKKLGCGAVLWELLRTRCGSFQLKDSLSLEEAKELAAQKQLPSALTSLNQTLTHLPRAVVNEAAVRLIQNGVSLSEKSLLEFPLKPVEEGTLLRLLSPEHELLALGQALQTINPGAEPDPENLIIHPQLVFSPPA